MKTILLTFIILLGLTASTVAQRKIKDGTVTGSSDLPLTQSILELESTNKGLLLPRLTTSQRDGITAAVEGLMIYNTTTKCIEYYKNAQWVSTCQNKGTATVTNIDCKNGTGFNGIGLSEKIRVFNARQVVSVTSSTPGMFNVSTDVVNGIFFSGVANFLTAGTQDVIVIGYGLPVQTGDFTFNIDNKCSFTVHVDETVTAICDGTQPTTVVEVTSSTGKVWMDRNLGATQAATSINDIRARGCLYFPGRGNDGHGNTYNSYTQSDFINEPTYNWTPPYDAWVANNPCPNGFRVPTRPELFAEFTAYNISDITTGFNSIFKFTASKGTAFDDMNYSVGFNSRVYPSFYPNGNSFTRTTNEGYLYTSTTTDFSNYYTFITVGHTTSWSGRRDGGVPVRCIKN